MRVKGGKKCVIEGEVMGRELGGAGAVVQGIMGKTVAELYIFFFQAEDGIRDIAV